MRRRAMAEVLACSAALLACHSRSSSTGGPVAARVEAADHVDAGVNASPGRGAASPSASADSTEFAEPCDREKLVKPAPDDRIYATWRTFALSSSEHGVDGKLRVLADSRVTRAGAAREGTHPDFSPCDLLRSRLELLDTAGRVLDHHEFDPELDVVAYHFAPRQTVYETRELVHCLASCWCGNTHAFWQVRGGKLAQLRAQQRSGKPALATAVTQNCYEGSEIAPGAEGGVELNIHRKLRVDGGWFETNERYWFDSEWRAAVRERPSE